MTGGTPLLGIFCCMSLLFCPHLLKYSTNLKLNYHFVESTYRCLAAPFSKTDKSQSQSGKFKFVEYFNKWGLNSNDMQQNIPKRGVPPITIWFLISVFEYYTIISYYFLSCLQGCIIVYDICSHKSFDSVTKWLLNIKEVGIKMISCVWKLPGPYL